MPSRHNTVAIAVADNALRDQLERIIGGSGYRAVPLPEPRLVVTEGAHYDHFILETSDDVAALCQIVYGLYASSPKGSRPSIIGIVSMDALNRSPSLGMWLIDDGAALVALLVRERGELARIPLLLNRVDRSRGM